MVPALVTPLSVLLTELMVPDPLMVPPVTDALEKVTVEPEPDVIVPPVFVKVPVSWREPPPVASRRLVLVAPPLPG